MSCHHDKPVLGHCIFGQCPNYRGNCPKHSRSYGEESATCTNELPLERQVEAVLNVIAPYVDGPPGFQPARWPIFRYDYEGTMVMPDDDQLQALARQIVTAVRAAL